MSSTPLEYGQPAVGFPAAQAPPLRRRHPLGLPAGSVRALLILMVVGTIWALLLMPKEKNVHVPLYLYYLAFLTVGSYFAGRSHAPPAHMSNEPHPLYLPRGSIRLIVIAGFIGVVGFAIYKNHDFLSDDLFDPRELLDPKEKPTITLPLILIGAFFLGIIVNGLSRWVLAGPEGLPTWYQDVLAWISVLAVLGLGTEVILQLVVLPSMEEANRFNLPPLQMILSGIIAFYFGVRTS